MKILYSEEIEKIKNIVEKHAKYQKVMLLYDENVSEIEINKIYLLIRNLCIFNKVEISKNIDEIYNGYKLLIFVCSSNSYIKTNANFEEFVNVFLPTDRGLLPYFLNNDCINAYREDYIFLNKIKIDESVIPSIIFNKFFNYLNDLIYVQNSEINFNFENKEITIFQTLSSIRDNIGLKFHDIEILKKCQLKYSDITILDYLLITAFEIVIKAINNHSLSLVDVYKSAKDNCVFIDKMYAMLSNNPFQILVSLNYNSIITLLEQSKNQILYYINFSNIDKDVENIIKSLKIYSKNDDGLLGYLYLYNIFGN